MSAPIGSIAVRKHTELPSSVARTGEITLLKVTKIEWNEFYKAWVNPFMHCDTDKDGNLT